MTRAPFLESLTALADPTRSRILLLLERHELTVGELCTALRLPQSTVSRHLKLLMDDQWLVVRGDGTSRYYSMKVEGLDAPLRDLWTVVRAQLVDSETAARDVQRAENVIEKRQSKMRVFFSNAAAQWDELRTEMIGARTDLLAMLEFLDERWVVGDLGCGTGHVAAALAPCVAHVIAVDESGPMLTAARERLAPFDNVELQEGTIEALPIDDATLDVATLFLVAHFISDPERAIGAIRRVLKPGGRLVIVDLVTHDRTDYVAELGHVWQGFRSEQMLDWLAHAGFTSCRYRQLPADPSAVGPTLFVASGRRGADVG
ncbi:MAG TPA: metalloregulator ArsR/SmtB family transcription factor [Gemmatimonadaceae bacterium]|nr:metalloregulator ArsR/SmtB family transcription factor [Gemmatimonadaceae bacterium]